MADLETVLAATNARWDLTKRLPVPQNNWMMCPICWMREPRIRFWRYHTRDNSETTPYRCDVSFKCTDCAFVWLHGVVVSEEHWNQRPLPHKDKICISWKRGRQYL